MNFLALLLGLGLERALTRLLRLREFRWLDRLIDRVFAAFGRAAPEAAFIGLLLAALGLALPVMYVIARLSADGQGAAFFVFAIVVLLFSLGPRDLEQEAEEYGAAADAGDEAALGSLGRELAEHDVATGREARAGEVERAIYLQANNRIFGVVFWFLVFGPVGAWLFRVVDLMRRRAVFARPAGEVTIAMRTLHGLFAWLPARLMAGTFALAGSFEAAATAWRASRGDGDFYERTDSLVVQVGRSARGAAAPDVSDAPAEAALVRSAMALVRRALWLVWYPAVALLTLGDFLR